MSICIYIYIHVYIYGQVFFAEMLGTMLLGTTENNQYVDVIYISIHGHRDDYFSCMYLVIFDSLS
jgi:hypothetical protein